MLINVNKNKIFALRVDSYSLSGTLIQRIFVSLIVWLGTVIFMLRLTFWALETKFDNLNPWFCMESKLFDLGAMSKKKAY